MDYLIGLIKNQFNSASRYLSFLDSIWIQIHYAYFHYITLIIIWYCCSLVLGLFLLAPKGTMPSLVSHGFTNLLYYVYSPISILIFNEVACTWWLFFPFGQCVLASLCSKYCIHNVVLLFLYLEVCQACR